MAEKISVQIALEGGAEVQRQLKGIGEAGQKAFDDLAKSAEQVGGFKNLKTDEVTAGLKAAGIEGKEFAQILKAVGTAAKFESVVTGVQSVEASLLNLGKVAVGIAAVFVAMIKPTIAFAEAINKASDQALKLGVSLDTFKQLQTGLEQAGLSGQTAAEGLAHFQQQLQKSIQQADPGSQLRLFGDAAKMLGPELEKLKAQLQSMPDGFERTSLAIEKMGQKAGTEFVQGLRRSEGSMSSTEATAYDLEQAFTQLGNATAKLGTLAFAPALTTGINAATTAVQALTTALGGLQQIGQSQIGQQIGETLQHAFTGLDSIIANVVGGIAQGMGASQQQVEALQQSILGIGQAGQQAGQQAAQGFQVWNEELGKAVPAAQTAATASQSAFQTITTAIQSAGTAVADFVTKIASITWDAISSAGVAAWDAITGAIQGAINRLLEFIGLKERSGGSGGSASGKASGGLIGGVGSGTSDSNLAWLSRGEFVTPAHIVRQPGVLGFLEAMRRSGRIPGYQGGGEVDFGASGTPQGGGARVQARGISPLADKISEWIDKILAVTGTVISATRAAAIELARVTESITNIGLSLSDRLYPVLLEMTNTVNNLRGATGQARGGLLGGRGTGTSDSNLAWVSRGEHIMPAHAVRQPGVLAFLEALRRSGGNLSAVLDGMGRFALGGLVPTGGGANLGTLTLGLPSGGSVTVRASSSVADLLRKEAALAQVRSGGRKPSRYS